MSPFFIMHLPKLPTVFVKGGEERKAFFTVQARELIAAGWVEKGTEAPKPVVKEEPKVETPAEEPDAAPGDGRPGTQPPPTPSHLRHRRRPFFQLACTGRSIGRDPDRL